jgi:hypothetical protein
VAGDAPEAQCLEMLDANRREDPVPARRAIGAESAGRALFAFAALALCACGAGPASPSRTAALTLAIVPDPVPEAPCPTSACGDAVDQLFAVGALRLSETNGVGGRVDSISMTQTSASRVVASGTFDAAAVAALAGSNRFTPNGRLEVPGIGVHYDRSLGSVEATLSVTVRATDDAGHSLSATAAVAVAPLPP